MHSESERLARFRWSAGAIAALVLVGGVALRFRYQPLLPPHPPRPAMADLAAFRALDYSANLYRAALEKDAAEAGLPPPAGSELARVFPYELAEPGRVVVAGGAALTTRDLSISARVGRVDIGLGSGHISMEHLILRIENTTDDAVAYRIEARLPVDPRACVDKGDLPHDALAIAPHHVVERTECARRGVSSVVVERVETMRLPPLSFHYVSRLFPAHVGLDARAARGHRPESGTICSDIPEQAIRRATEKGEVSWRDVIDFYARHNCARYIFPVGYQAFTRNEERSLPVAPGAAGRSP